MGTFDAGLRLDGDSGPPLDVELDLNTERLRVTADNVDVAEWQLDQIRITALEDGFHVLAEGHEVILNVSQDGRFAVELGLRSAHPTLRRRMAAVLRGDPSIAPEAAS